ncbi:MAG: hypothetical protein WBV69_00155 [Candidatus Sulfotelmatobacter sp.]
MTSRWKWCVTLLVATTMVAQTATPPKPRKKTRTVTAADVQALKDAIALQAAAIAVQQTQIQALQDELHAKDQATKDAQAVAVGAAATAAAAQVQITQQQAAVVDLKADVSDLRTNVNNTAVTLQETQKTIHTDLESPLAIHYKGITITPGGFAAAEFVRRSRALGADINTPFNSLTMPGASQSNISEFFGSGRQSRISALAEGRLSSAKLSGYVEADFLSAGVTSNNNESNSYTLRQRQAWGQAAMDNGWSVTGGQMWSLLTETKHGVDNRTEAVPMTIDPQYTVGFSWARQYGLRLAKNFSNKVWFAVSMENAQATVTSHNNGNNFLVGSAGAGGGLYNGAVTNCTTALNSTDTAATTTCTLAASYSFNPAPDIVAKLAFEPGFGHYEIFGLYDRFRDRIFPCGEVASSSTTPCGGATTAGANGLGAFNSSKNGGGGGFNARWSFANKRLDFGLHGFGGSGVGRYGTGGLADTSIHANGTFDLVRSLQGLTTLEWHGPKLDIYLNAGAEYAGRAADFDPISGKYVGYGSPFFSNTGCYSETSPSLSGGFFPGSLSSCTADTRALIEGTAGFWYRFYTGPKGRLQFGTQYSYVTRQTWSGVGPSGSGAPGVTPEGLDNMVFTSFRYYLP